MNFYVVSNYCMLRYNAANAIMLKNTPVSYLCIRSNMTSKKKLGKMAEK